MFTIHTTHNQKLRIKKKSLRKERTPQRPPHAHWDTYTHPSHTITPHKDSDKFKKKKKNTPDAQAISSSHFLKSERYLISVYHSTSHNS